MTKTCCTCKEVKDISCFNKNKAKSDGYSNRCRVCKKDYREKNKERISLYNKEYKLKNEEKILNQNLQFYGISIKEKEEMLQKQNWECPICLNSLKIKSKLVHVDHCHTTNAVRGILCSRCNRLLGLAKDDTAILGRAADYLKINNEKVSKNIVDNEESLIKELIDKKICIKREVAKKIIQNTPMGNLIEKLKNK